MANWCYTSITFYAETKEKETLEKMYRDFGRIYDGMFPAENELEGGGWMGDYADVYFPKLGHINIDCRGSVQCIGYIQFTPDEKYAFFEIDTETAWDAKMGLWNEIVNNFYPSIKIAYISEEPGCDYLLCYDDSKGHQFYQATFYLSGCVPTKTGKLEYLDSGESGVKYFDGTIEELQDYFDSILPFAYERKDNIAELDAELNSAIDDYVENTEFEGEAYIHLSEFEEYPPSEFELCR